jgi:hypothetical protein
MANGRCASVQQPLQTVQVRMLQRFDGWPLPTCSSAAQRHLCMPCRPHCPHHITSSSSVADNTDPLMRPTSHTPDQVTMCSCMQPAGGRWRPGSSVRRVCDADAVWQGAAAQAWRAAALPGAAHHHRGKLKWRWLCSCVHGHVVSMCVLPQQTLPLQKGAGGSLHALLQQMYTHACRHHLTPPRLPALPCLRRFCCVRSCHCSRC